MKKAFIQKLSIAMASALVITAAAPATADAAAAMKMNKSSKTLYLNEDNMTNTKDTYDFSIKNKPTNYKTKYSFSWYAENDKIVNVAKGGVVTAKKVGQTTVKCDIIKKSTGKVYKTVKTVVTVKANADTVTIKNAPEDGEMAIGTTFDFNRTMKAANGGTATDKTEWVLSADKDGKEATDIASVDKNGLVTALKAGTFFITAKTYQSATAKDLGYTATSEAVEVKVYASITEAKNTTTSKFQLTFDADMSKSLTKDNITVTNASGVKQAVKSVAFSTDGTVATVELWTPMTDKVVYKVAVPEVKAVEFTASVGAPATITLTGPTLVADNEETELKAELKDANGVVVNAGSNGRIVFSTTASTDAWINGNNITIFQIGKVVPVKATYYTGTFDSTGNEVKIESEVVSITCVDTVAPTVASASTATVTAKTNGKDADWTNASTTLPVNDTDKYLQIRYVKSDGNTAYTNNGETETWTFESTDTTKLIVNASTGKLLPLAEGQVVVIAKCGTFTQSYIINITAKRVAASVTTDVSGVSLSFAPAVADSRKVYVTVKDNYGADYTANTAPVVAEPIGTDATKASANATLTVSSDAESVTFSVNTTGADRKAGTYTYKLTKADKSVLVSVVVTEPTTTVSYGKVKVDTTSFDTKVTSGSALGKITVSLSQIATNGIELKPVTQGTIKYTVKHSDGTEVKGAYVEEVSPGVIAVKPVITSGSAYSKLKTGTYTVTATVDDKATTDGKTIIASTFEVKDTQTTTAVKTKSLTLETTKGAGDIKELLKANFELADDTNRTFAVTGIKTTVANDNITAETGTYSVYVQTITVSETIGGFTLNTDVAVNTTITVTVK